MKLLFSGAKHYLSAQNDVTMSLGGFMSSTRLPNGRLNSLFSDISIYGKMIGSKECIAFYLLNDTNEEIKNLTLEQIKPKDSNCNFIWGAVMPTQGEKIQIELIGSMKEEPYNVDWFEPTTIKESCVVKVINGGVIGDVVDILGVEFDLTNSSIESVVDDCVLAFKNNPLYFVEKIDGSSFKITRLEKGISNAPIIWVATGTSDISPVSFSGGQIGTTEILDSLKPNEAIAFWLKREIIEIGCVDELVEDCLDLSCVENTKENLEVIFSYD